MPKPNGSPVLETETPDLSRLDASLNPTIGIYATLPDGTVILLRGDADTLLLTRRPSPLRRLILYLQGWSFSHAVPRNPLL